jgi:hypothetical protein
MPFGRKAGLRPAPVVAQPGKKKKKTVGQWDSRDYKDGNNAPLAVSTPTSSANSLLVNSCK